MNVKKNIVLPIGLLLALVIVTIPAVLLFNGISKFSTANQELKASIRELQVLHDRDPFPSRENIKQEKDNVAELQQWFRRLLGAFQQGQITEESSTPTGFITRYGYTRNALLNRAAKARKEMIQPDFAFGFRQYAEGSLPAPVNVGRLMQQLKMIEQLASVVIDAGAERLTEISRDAFEAAPEERTRVERTSRLRRPSRRTRQPEPRRDSGTTGTGGNQTESDLYDKEHFTLAVRAREATLVEILNQLASHDLFIVVNGVEIKKTGPDVRLPQSLDAQATGEDKPAEALTTPVTETDARDLPRQQRRVSGPEFELPMDVTIELDVYTFTPETDSEEHP